MTSSRTLTESSYQLRCIDCGIVGRIDGSALRCERCGDLLEVVFPDNRMPEPEALKATWMRRRSSELPQDTSGVWRFREMLPNLEARQAPITLREGNTPIYELPRCARSAGVAQLLAKHQGMNPTGSFKDTGMTVAASFARQAGYEWVACASTGNTSASMAAYAARAGMRSLVLIPEGHITWGKLSQALDYGALTCQLKTDFDGCLKLLEQITRLKRIYVLNSINPYRLEGQKTTAIELMEQLEWKAPDHIVVPGGNLGNSSALGKALIEMKAAGLIPSLPRLFIVQAEGANALVRTMREADGKKLVPVQAETMATAIRIGSPASWKKAVRVLQATGGAVEEVAESEIAVAKAEIGSDGVGCEPASAVTLAGLKKLVSRGLINPNERTVLILTGHVLKDPDYTINFHRGDLFKDQKTIRSHRRPPVAVDANPGAILKMLEQHERATS